MVSRASSKLCSAKFPIDDDLFACTTRAEDQFGSLKILERFLGLFGSLGTRQDCSRIAVCEHGSAREPYLDKWNQHEKFDRSTSLFMWMMKAQDWGMDGGHDDDESCSGNFT